MSLSHVVVCLSNFCYRFNLDIEAAVSDLKFEFKFELFEHCFFITLNSSNMTLINCTQCSLCHNLASAFYYQMYGAALKGQFTVRCQHFSLKVLSAEQML